MQQFDAYTLTSSFEVTVISLFDAKLTALLTYMDGGIRAGTAQYLNNHDRAAVDAYDLVFDDGLRGKTQIPKHVQAGLARTNEVLS